MKHLTRLISTVLLISGMAIAGFAQQAAAQAWPAKPLRIVVNFPPGGAADVIARAVAPGLGEALGQQLGMQVEVMEDGSLVVDGM